MTFGLLSVLILAGLAGPLFGALGRGVVPVVVGELIAGLALGRSGLNWLKPDEVTTAFLANVGFAMLMFSAGMQIPVRRPGLSSHIRRGAVAAAIAAALAVVSAWPIARITHSGHPWLLAVVLASGSAAVVVPSLEEAGLLDLDSALVVAAQVAIADVASIVAVPLVLDPHRVGRALVGGAVIAVCAAAFLLLLLALRRRAWIRSLRKLSKKRRWALDLRLSLLLLFGLCWLAITVGTSILIAGFAVGLIVAALGGPKRLSRQVTGVADGFFIPLFFVVLGASIDLRSFVRHGDLLVLAAFLIAANVLLHVVTAKATQQSPASGLVATAQLGVPAAVVTLGLQGHVISPGEGAAILIAALASIAVAVGAVAAFRQRREAPVPADYVVSLTHK